jgi:predicted nucleotidyltransferase
MPLPLQDLLTELKSALLAIYGVHMKGLCLYGSYARGEQQSESDVDVLIIVDRIDRYSLEIERTSELISKLSLKYHRSISRLFVTEDDWKNRDTPFLANAREEAVVA